MPPPTRTPIGLQLARASKAVGRAFDDALSEAGGSLPTWLVLVSLKTRRLGNQRELADAVGIREATLTHHLTAMESAGLVTRHRDPENRRVQRVELTTSGEAAFLRLAAAATAFDERLRNGISEKELVAATNVLERLGINAGEPT